jgi:uncharacterized membrane protein
VLRKRKSERRSRISRRVLAATFVGAGVLHFVKPEPYEMIMPPGLPYPRELVYLSGVAEIVGGLGVLSGRLRPWAGWWLIAVLVAVFPANVYMAIDPDEVFRKRFPAVALWLRLPLQGAFVAWVWSATAPARALR